MPLSRAEMVRAAREAGFGEASERLITGWVQLGLLDHPVRVARPKGSGRGAYYLWSDNQRALFLLLLSKHREIPAVASLAVIPVATWLYWGDDWISLTQVRKAMDSWSGQVGRSAERDESNARAIWRALIGNRRLPDERRWFVETLTPLLNPQVGDEARVRELVVEVFARLRGNQLWGPSGYDAEDFALYVYALVAGVQRFKQLDDDVWMEARARVRQGVATYANQWFIRAQHPQFGAWFKEPTGEVLVNSACKHLLTVLGGIALAREAGDQLPPVIGGER